MARRAAEWRDGSVMVHFGDGLAALSPGPTVLEALVALRRTSHCMGAPAVRFVQRESSIALRGEAGPWLGYAWRRTKTGFALMVMAARRGFACDQYGYDVDLCADTTAPRRGTREGGGSWI
jgi:hypothetical protein